MNTWLHFQKISTRRTDLYVGQKYPYEINTGTWRYREFVLQAGPGWSLVLRVPPEECLLPDPW